MCLENCKIKNIYRLHGQVMVYCHQKHNTIVLVCNYSEFNSSPTVVTPNMLQSTDITAQSQRDLWHKWFYKSTPSNAHAITQLND